MVNKPVGVGDHGGSLERARALFPDAPEPWIDLSTGINPHHYPLLHLPVTSFSRLPEPGRNRQLAAVAAAAYGAPAPCHVAPAPGTQILLALVASLIPPSRARILSPTYSGHGCAAALAGHQVEETGSFDALFDANLAIAVNPNNPDGRIIERSHLLALVGSMRRKGGLVIVDEAFMDIGPRQHSVAGDVADGGLIVLRSFGKFYGLAGVRLGFALGGAGDIERLEGRLGPWAVAGPAVETGLRALADEQWRERMRARLEREAARLDGLFAEHGVAAAGGTSLFRFFQLEQAQTLFEIFGRHGILTRNFAGRPHDLRVGLPANSAEMKRIGLALQDWRRLDVSRGAGF